jgi:hypothetical protein
LFGCCSDIQGSHKLELATASRAGKARAQLLFWAGKKGYVK